MFFFSFLFNFKFCLLGFAEKVAIINCFDDVPTTADFSLKASGHC